MRYTTTLMHGKLYDLSYMTPCGQVTRRARYMGKTLSGVPYPCAACGRPARDYLVFFDDAHGYEFAVSLHCWRYESTRVKAPKVES